MVATEQQKLLLLDWARKVHSLEYGHRLESKSKEGINMWLGIPSIIMATLVAGFASFPKVEGSDAKTVVVIGSIICSAAVAILTGVQTFIKPSEQAEKHRFFSSLYEALRHKIEQVLVTPDLTSEYVLTQLAKIEKEFHKLREHSPNVSSDNWDKGKAIADNLKSYPKSMKYELSPK